MKLIINTIEALRLGGVVRLTIYSNGILKVRKVGRLKILKSAIAIAIYLILAMAAPSPANILDTSNIKLFASVKKYEFGNFIRQSEVAFGFEVGGCATRNQNKMAKKTGSKP
jgi:hypothetical protein